MDKRIVNKRRSVMANKGKSEKNIFGGGYTHYDSNGKKIGRSEPNIFVGG